MTVIATSRLPLVRLALIKPFLAEMERCNVDFRSILAARDITQETVANSEVFVPAETVYSVLNQFALAANNPYLGFEQGLALNVDSWGPLASASKTAHTIADLLAACAQNARADASSVTLRLTTDGVHAEFNVARADDPSCSPAQADAFWIGLLVSVLENSCGAAWQPEKLTAYVSDIQTIPPSNKSIRISEHGKGGPKVRFPCEWLLITYNCAALDSDHEEIEQSFVAGTFLESLRQTLQPHISEPELDATLAAKLCEIGRRTLEMRLRKLGTTIKHEIDDLRQQQAKQDLQNSNLSISEIAVRAGYLTPANFSRAFKRWTGASPSEFRQRCSSKSHR